MLKEIIEALRSKDALGEMTRRLGEMLETGRWMFAKASEVLMRQVDWPGIAQELYAKDRQINQIEQGVRERIVTHLSVGHSEDLSACLVFMSVVKDAERIGDYCKNIFEIGKFYQREFAHPLYAEPLEKIRGAITPLFDKAEQAFTETDANLAEEVLVKARQLTQECDLIVQRLLGTTDRMGPDEAVAYVLLARFCKRVTAHLANIATSVVSPVPMLDYHQQSAGD